MKNDEQIKSAEAIVKSDEYDISSIAEITTDNGETALIWKSDLAGLFRIQSQLVNEGTSKWVGYSFCYVVLVLFTLFFAFTYVKRVIYMAFLTMIAPLVAMTYPIDKITDGKAQAFDSWLKEYIFNLMIQPLHLLLYTILVSSAYVLATESPLYALVAIGFMMPAEKLMRKFFGFEKAKTPGLLGGAAGAAIAMTGLQGLFKHKSSGGNGRGNSSGKGNDTNKVRFSNKNKGNNTMDDITGMKPGEGGNANQNTTPNVNALQTRNMLDSGADSGENKKEWDSRLTQEQKDEMMADGIAPGDAEYDGTLRQYGLDSNFGEETLDEDDILADTTLGSEDWDHDGFGSENVGDAPEISNVETTGEAAGKSAGESAGKSSTDRENGSEKQHKRSIMRAIGSVAGNTLKQGGKQLGRQVATGVLTGIHPLKLAGKVAAGATVATAGLLIGTASGDPNKAFQYTTAGAVAGSALAGSLSRGSEIDAEPISEAAKMAYYGPEYKQKLIEKEKKKFQTSDENINYIRKIMGVTRSEAKQILESTGSECYDRGITDIKDVATIHKLKNPKDGKEKMSIDKAAAARTYAKRRLGGVDADQMTEDTVREYQNRWAKEFKERYKVDDKKAYELSQKAFDAAIRFNKTYSGLTKVEK